MTDRLTIRRMVSVVGGAALALGLGTLVAVLPGVAPAHATLERPALAVPVFAEAGAGCTVSDASLSWGVIERWRAYITGTIANGDWALVDGAEYATPQFRWPAGSGALEADGSGEIAFAGGVLFSGHEGLLKLNLANPTLELVSPSEAYLLLDLSSTKPTGEPDVALPQVRAVKIDLEGAIVADGTTLKITDASGRFTAEGASAFGGFYAAGEEVDPISLFASAPGCVLASGSETAQPEEVAVEPQAQPVAQEEADIPWLPLGIGAVAVLVIGIASGVLLRGGKPKAPSAVSDHTDSGSEGSGVV